MKSARILLASLATLAENKIKCSSLKVEYISAPETCDKKAMNGHTVVIHYTGTFEDGTKFVSDVGQMEKNLSQLSRDWKIGSRGLGHVHW